MSVIRQYAIVPLLGIALLIATVAGPNVSFDRTSVSTNMQLIAASSTNCEIYYPQELVPWFCTIKTPSVALKFDGAESVACVWRIRWGDSTRPEDVTFSYPNQVTASHTYQSPGTYDVIGTYESGGCASAAGDLSFKYLVSYIPDTKPVGPLSEDSSAIPCAPGTDDLGVHPGYVKGKKVSIRLCAVESLPSTGDESTPSSKYYVPGADGKAIVNSRVSGAVAAMVAGILFEDPAVNKSLYCGPCIRKKPSATSSFRTYAHQKYLYDNWKKTGKNGPCGEARIF
jgi:hypothetical protein